MKKGALKDLIKKKKSTLVGRYTLLEGDSGEVLKTLPSASYDSLITDPPAGVSFMLAKWDSDKGGRDQWIKWLASIMRECNRCLKPGGHALIWALPRTSHWTATAVENAGFEIRDVITWVYGQGFPKSMNISKQFDKAAGERKVVGTAKGVRVGDSATYSAHGSGFSETGSYEVTESVTDDAKQWEGWGTALKPASEHWILARKPLHMDSVAENVKQFKTGAINVDAGRVGVETIKISQGDGFGTKGVYGTGVNNVSKGSEHQGRWPSNFILTHSADCKRVGTKTAGSGSKKKNEDVNRSPESASNAWKKPPNKTDGLASYGTETVEDWKCTKSCPVHLLDEQSGQMPKSGGDSGRRNSDQFLGAIKNNGVTLTGRSVGDSGGASRFFKTFDPFYYCPKPAPSKRNEGLGGEKKATKGGGGESGAHGSAMARQSNHHPTVKPTALMQYLAKLITPPGGHILDPFMGSGTTGVAARKEGFRFTGIELSPDYFKLASRRIKQ